MSLSSSCGRKKAERGCGLPRHGKKRKGKLFLPEEFAESAERVTDGGGRVAVVFGNERTGLTDGELEECGCGVTMPSSDEFASLNLSHAVQLVAYELFRRSGKGRTGYTPITLSRLETTVGAITESLARMGFFRRVTDDGMASFWRQLLSRAALSEGEAQYIEKDLPQGRRPLRGQGQGVAGAGGTVIPRGGILQKEACECGHD